MTTSCLWVWVWSPPTCPELGLVGILTVVCPPESPGAYPDPIPERPRLGSKSPSGNSDVQAGLRNPMLDKESKAQRGQVTYPRSHSKPGGDPGVWILDFTRAAPGHLSLPGRVASSVYFWHNFTLLSLHLEYKTSVESHQQTFGKCNEREHTSIPQIPVQ